MCDEDDAACEVTEVNVTFENNWEYTDIHIDLEVPYKETYQIRMLNSNEISGLMKVKGSGRDGQTRYTYRINGGNSMQKEFAGKEMKKEDVVTFTKDLIDTVDELREHLLDPDGLLLSPELIFIRDGRYRFCYPQGKDFSARSRTSFSRYLRRRPF